MTFVLGDKSILGELLTEFGQLGAKLGSEMLSHEVDLEKNVVDPLNQVENEALNIAKARRNLNKLILDMDSARTRYSLLKVKLIHWMTKCIYSDQVPKRAKTGHQRG